MRDADAPDGRDRSWDVARSIVVPAVLAAAAVGAGTAGYALYLRALPAYGDAVTAPLVGEAFFRSLGFLVLSMGAAEAPAPPAFALLTIGRAAGLLFFSYAAVAGVGYVFADRLRPLRVEAWSLVGRLPGVDDRGHVIVCGVGDDGYALATEALDAGRNVVAVDTTETDRTADLDAMGAAVFVGDATHAGVLSRRARLRLADDVFVTAGSSATNGAVVEAIDRQIAATPRSEPLAVTARIDDRRLRRALHGEVDDTDGLHLRTYDVPSATARELLARHPVDDIEDPDQRLHVWIVGWTSLSRALVDRLRNLMHYPEGIDRQVTVLTERPDAVEAELASLSPGADPDRWTDPSMREYVRTLFPDVDVRALPASDMELLSDRTPLYDSLRPHDRLTIVADDTDERSLRALLSVWGPKLDDVARRLDLTATLAYRSPPDAGWRPSLSAVETTPYTDFGDGCSIRAVRGTDQDRIARRLALVYHLLYEDDPADALPGLGSLPDPVADDPGIDAVIEWLDALPTATREQYAAAVWRDLPEYQRDSNRYAADHAAVKRRMAAVLRGPTPHAAGADRTGGPDPDAPDPQTVRAIAESEHRRWCAEKLLDGWEPLPDGAAERWATEAGECALRDQRYHPEIRPVEAVRAEADGEWDKDVSQVEAILSHPGFVGAAGPDGDTFDT